MKNKILSIVLIVSTGLVAQVKVGTNPTNLATNTLFQVEGTTIANQFVFLKNGNVGIGLTNPTAQFETTGTLKFAGAGTPGAGKVLASDALGNATWATLPAAASASNGLTATSGDVKLGGTLTQATSIANAGFNLGITGTGNLGIGTATPASKLQVVLGSSNGNLADWTANSATFGEAGNRGSALGIGYDSTNNEAWITSLSPSTAWRSLKFNAKSWKFLADGTREILTVNNNGTVGINTTVPNSIPNFTTNALEITDESGGALSDITQRVIGSGFPSYNFISHIGTASAPLIPTSAGHILGQISFISTTGGASNFVAASRIQSFIEGTPGSNNFGASMTFSTKPSNSVTPVTRMYINPLGNVGIGAGNTSPSYRLDVTSSDGITARFKSTSTDPNGVIIVDIPTVNAACNTCSELMMFTKGGTTVMGNILANLSANSVSYNTTSDKRLKEDIKVPAIGINELMKIQIADYHRIGSPKEQREIGYIAQQLHTIFPDAVTPGAENVSEKPWMVDYGRITPLLVKAIQDQQAKIEILKAKIEILTKK